MASIEDMFKKNLGTGPGVGLGALFAEARAKVDARRAAPTTGTDTKERTGGYSSGSGAASA